MDIISELNGKRILIWGYGREGKATEHFLQRCVKPASVDIFEGKKEEIDEDDYDFIIKSPGIVMNEENPKYTSETELFLQQFRDQVIGITGTKGKSTTSAMLYTVLKACSSRPVLLLGNIGQPCLDYFEEVTEDTIIVYEMSCHQLAHTNVSPHIAIFLNLYEEHLDYYGTVKKYFEAKSHIAAYQKSGDYFFVGENVPQIDTKAQRTVLHQPKGVHYELKLAGEHNQYDAQFVERVAELLGCEKEAVLKSMADFEGLPHRLGREVGALGDMHLIDQVARTVEPGIAARVQGDGVGGAAAPRIQQVPHHIALMLVVYRGEKGRLRQLFDQRAPAVLPVALPAAGQQDNAVGPLKGVNRQRAGRGHEMQAAQLHKLQRQAVDNPAKLREPEAVGYPPLLRHPAAYVGQGGV